MPEQVARTRDNAAALYFGDVMHARLKPVGHRFSYRVMSLLIDLDRLDDADRQSRLFGVNRAALYSFHEADHGHRDGSPLRDYVRSCAAERGIDLTGGRVLLLCYPRLLGFTFNPLSVYFCYRSGWRTGAADLRSPQHLWRHPSVCAAGQDLARSAPPACGSSRKSCSTSRPLSKWRCAIISALRRRRARQAAHSRDRSRRSLALRNLQRTAAAN